MALIGSFALRAHCNYCCLTGEKSRGQSHAAQYARSRTSRACHVSRNLHSCEVQTIDECGLCLPPEDEPPHYTYVLNYDHEETCSWFSMPRHSTLVCTVCTTVPLLTEQHITHLPFKTCNLYESKPCGSFSLFLWVNWVRKSLRNQGSHGAESLTINEGSCPPEASASSVTSAQYCVCVYFFARFCEKKKSAHDPTGTRVKGDPSSRPSRAPNKTP